MTAFLWIHLASNRSRLITESTLVTAAVLIGFSLDWILLHGGWVAYEGALTVASVPLWMLALWAGFGATLTHSQKLFVASPTRGFLVGSFGGPAAYTGGERLGRMVINGPEGLVAIGVTWALALCALALLVSKVELSSSQSSSAGTGELADQLEPASKERLKTFA
jgi:hypothetical protein